MASNKASASASFSYTDNNAQSEANRKKSTMRKILGGLTRSFTNYEENCEESKNFFDIITTEMNDEDFKNAPYLLKLKNVLEEGDFLYEIKQNENVKENFYFLQDKYMRLFFDFYPDYICVDVIGELPKLKLNMYLFTGIDTNGSCEILALGFVKSGDAGIKWLCDTFIKHNQKSVDKVTLILTSKILRENQIFQNSFFGKPIITSVFHFMQSLKKELSDIGFNANDENTEKIMIIFEKMFATSSRTEWSNLFKELEQKYEAVSKNDRILLEIKRQSIVCKKVNFALLSRSFTVIMYSVREALRPIIYSFDTFEEILTFCSTILKNNRQEKFKNLLTTYKKPTVNAELVDYLKYSEILTPFATKLVVEQIDNSGIMTIPSPDDIVDQNFTVSSRSCNCYFYLLLSLPCKHIFYVRRRLGRQIFDESLCSKKWFKSNYKEVLLKLFTVFFEQIANRSFQECKIFFGIGAHMWPRKCSDDIAVRRFFILQYLVRVWDQELKVNVWEPPVSFDLSADSRYLISVLRSYNACCSLGYKTFEQLYGISLKDILNCDDYKT